MQHEATGPADIDAARLPDRSRHAFVCIVDAGEGLPAHRVPVLVLCGRGPGPRLMLVGGVHGDEADGIAACFELWRSLEVDSFNGRVVILPIAHVAAFEAGQRRSPHDGADLNRVCPGDPEGEPTSRLAAGLATIVRGNADFLFTLHGWYATGVAAPHVEYDIAESAGQEASRTACFAAGFRDVVAAEWPPGLLPKVAVAAGIPAMEAEIGGLAATSAANVAFLRARIGDLMAHLGMVAGAPPAVAAGAVRHHRHVLAPADGVLDVRIEVGAQVEAGALLAAIHDLAGHEVARVVAPAAGLLATRRSVQRVARGDHLFALLVTA
jgi:predicted deacylase